MNHILGFDIGNTNTVLGIFKEKDTTPIKTYRFRTEKNITIDELGFQVKNFVNHFFNETNNRIIIRGMAFSSVVTEVNKSYKKMSREYFNLECLEINSSIELGINLRYDNPEQLGPDRIVNAVGANKEYSEDCVIIDLGTANTFCVIHKDGTFDGGLIGPGIGIAINALAKKTSNLLKVNFQKPDKFIATNSIDAIKSGFFYGYILMINGIIAKIEEEYKKSFLIILTGGFSNIIGNNIEKKNIIDPLLTMKGIKYIYDINNS